MQIHLDTAQNKPAMLPKLQKQDMADQTPKTLNQ